MFVSTTTTHIVHNLLLICTFLSTEISLQVTPVYPQCHGRASLVLPTAKWAWLVGVAKTLPPAHSSIRYLCAPYAKYSLRQTSMQTMGRSPDISVMWRTEYYAGAGYIRHVAVKRLM